MQELEDVNTEYEGWCDKMDQQTKQLQDAGVQDDQVSRSSGVCITLTQNVEYLCEPGRGSQRLDSGDQQLKAD